MSTKGIAGVVGTAIFLAIAWFFVSPLFVDETVDEPSPLAPVARTPVPANGPEAPGAESAPSADAPMPTREEIEAMQGEERDSIRNALMEKARSEPDSAMDEPMGSEATARQIAEGTFRDVDAIHKGSGRALLYELPDGRHLLRFEDFRVTNGPALVVVLAEAPEPKSAAEVLRGYREIGPLKGNVGNQNYELPPDLDVSQYGSVAIWCELFDVLFSPAPLERSMPVG